MLGTGPACVQVMLKQTKSFAIIRHYIDRHSVTLSAAQDIADGKHSVSQRHIAFALCRVKRTDPRTYLERANAWLPLDIHPDYAL